MSALADLEAATTVKLFPSGLAALTGAMLAVLRAGDDILVSDGAYKPTRRFCDQALRRFGVAVRYYGPPTSAEELLAMAEPTTRLIVMESPSSLTFEVQDVPTIARLAKARGILTLVDNTWAAGMLFKPLDHGVDISVQALTKYVGGHSDVFMGSAATSDAVVGRALDQAIWDFGWSVSPDDAYQMLRGLRTLPVRLERHGVSGLVVARWLAGHPAVVQSASPCPARGFRAWLLGSGLFGGRRRLWSRAEDARGEKDSRLSRCPQPLRPRLLVGWFRKSGPRLRPTAWRSAAPRRFGRIADPSQRGVGRSGRSDRGPRPGPRSARLTRNATDWRPPRSLG